MSKAVPVAHVRLSHVPFSCMQRLYFWHSPGSATLSPTMQNAVVTVVVDVGMPPDGGTVGNELMAPKSGRVVVVVVVVVVVTVVVVVVVMGECCRHCGAPTSA